MLHQSYKTNHVENWQKYTCTFCCIFQIYHNFVLLLFAVYVYVHEIIWLQICPPFCELYSSGVAWVAEGTVTGWSWPILETSVPGGVTMVRPYYGLLPPQNKRWITLQNFLQSQAAAHGIRHVEHSDTFFWAWCFDFVKTKSMHRAQKKATFNVRFNKNDDTMLKADEGVQTEQSGVLFSRQKGRKRPDSNWSIRALLSTEIPLSANNSLRQSKTYKAGVGSTCDQRLRRWANAEQALQAKVLTFCHPITLPLTSRCIFAQLRFSARRSWRTKTKVLCWKNELISLPRS